MSTTTTLRIDGEDGSSDEIAVPASLLDLLADGEETPAETIGDLAVLSCAQQIHAISHHSQGEPDEEIQTIEEETMVAFEERFGATFAEMTGHDH
ncbi:DUF7545 family protein [Halalkalicoccus jeotgali]|uniref:Uncharacterized protein n=1 Tax=Halalkalicoccus jeotgali (strain DSM 18796 / CECT 7217 / JCM 14584 / KCTC 4019 / B3) TaxID=795797 RepID=D8J2X2_HALJB|nr:hypothetical protein [Halalkalicoccus jeotgali]ADJ15079.1 hypothetical protein HacjB3_08480 [Halalkalicoccus jeotgali B3]ELY34902.1 hypothetical protein C497_14222 [Halalkalicoccus jeotgali B3]